MSTIKVQNIQHTASSTNAIALASDGTCIANITNNLSNRRLTINGDMKIAQRGTSSTSDGYATVDRFTIAHNGDDEAPTQAQVDVASGTTPYTLGFRKALKITNGNQTGGAGSDDVIGIAQRLEAQDIAQSGWNYTSSSSYITLSFWVKSSVAQNFYIRLFTQDGTQKNYPMETGSLTADTWTKITKTISGHADLQFDLNSDRGLDVDFSLFRGTNQTASGVTLNQWSNLDATQKIPDMTSTWYTTNNSTFEVTGVQLEVGSFSSDFEFKSFSEELIRCQRYFWKTYNYAVTPGTASDPGSIFGRNYSDAARTQNTLDVRFPVTMRTTPTTVNAYAPHSGTIANVSSDGSNAPACGTERAFTQPQMLGESGFSSIQTGTSIPATQFFGAHFTCDAEL